MRANVGDQLHIHAGHTDTPDQYGRIIEVHGADGAPPYLVEFPHGHTRLIFPGPDAVVEPPRRVGGESGSPHKPGRSRRVHTRAGW